MRIFGQNNFFKKTILIAFLAFSLSLAPIQTQKADALWGEVMQQFLKQALEEIAKYTKGYILGSLKQMAAQMINEQIANLISGTSSGDSKIIGNYKDFLYTETTAQANLFLNDYLSQMTGGKGSLSNYIPAEGFGGGSGGNFSQQLVEMAKKATLEQVTMQVDYIGDPGQNMFANGNLDNFNKYLSGVNNPWAFQLHAQQKYQERLEIERDAARTEALIGQGFRSTKQGDSIITPGSIVVDAASNVMDLGNKIIAGATSVPEAITATVTQIITQSIESGIGMASQIVEREGGSSNWINPDTQANSNNETSNWINPDTGKPMP